MQYYYQIMEINTEVEIRYEGTSRTEEFPLSKFEIVENS